MVSDGEEGWKKPGSLPFMSWYHERKSTSPLTLFLWFKPGSITLKQGEGGGDVEGEALSCETESNGTLSFSISMRW